jgi:hypothetical protein
MAASRTGQLATLAFAAQSRQPALELAWVRRTALDTGRITMAAQRDWGLAVDFADWAPTTWPLAAPTADQVSPRHFCRTRARLPPSRCDDHESRREHVSVTICYRESASADDEAACHHHVFVPAIPASPWHPAATRY